MVDAGRILIMPKGIWSNLVSYEMLDVVTQDNIAYLARQSSVGVSPKNDSSYTYWQPFGTSVTPDGETIIMNSAGNITANIDNKSLIYDGVNTYVKVAIDGSTIKYDNSNGYLYVDASTFNINDLNNISITSPANGQVLVYDSTTQKWKNGEGSVSPIDNLTSNSTTQPLSANQGRVLNNQKLEKEIISDAWNASTTYEVGQYCIYNNSLWKCLVQHSGQTPTEGTYWTKVTVANEITSVNNSINDYEELILSNYGSNLYGQAVRYGKLVVITFGCYDRTIEAKGKINTKPLPLNFRPSVNKVSGMIYGSSAQNILNISTDGYMINPSGASQINFTGSIVYLVE